VADGSGDAELAEEGLCRDWPAHLEARVVRLADRITRPIHDLDDGIEEGAIRLREAETLGIVRELVTRLGEGLVRTRRVERLHQLNRGMVHLLVTSAVTTSAGRLAAWMAEERISGHDDFLERRESLPDRLIGLSPAVEGMLTELESFVERRVLNDARARRGMEQGRRLTADLFAAFYGSPLLLDDHVLLRFKERAGVRYLRDLPPDRIDEEVASRYRDSIVFVRLIADHLAAMSDTYASGEARRLGLPRG
jgi:dGTPase